MDRSPSNFAQSFDSLPSRDRVQASSRGVAGPTHCAIEDRIPEPPVKIPLLSVSQRKDGQMVRPAPTSYQIVSAAADVDAPASRVRLRSSRVPCLAGLSGIAFTDTHPELP